MKINSACDCCDGPIAARIVIQHVSFNRSCNNPCFLYSPPICFDSNGDPITDFLLGPFLTAFRANGSATGQLVLFDGDYTANYSRTTSAFLELYDTNTGNTNPLNCPCEHGYDETQSSNWEELYNAEDDDGPYQDRCYMDCNTSKGSGSSAGAGGAFNGGGGEFGGGGASGSWASGTSDTNYSTLPSEIIHYVNGGSEYLTNQQISNLANTLKQYEEQTGNQLVLVVAPNNPSGTYDPFVLAQQYGVGKGGGGDNGLVVFIHPESQNWQVATGYGLEADLPDASVNQIMNEAFGSGASDDLFGAISGAVEGFTGIATPNSPNGGVGDGTTIQGQNCELECPPQLNPEITALFGGGVSGSYVEGCEFKYSGEPGFGESFEETYTFGENCTAGGCPVPPFLTPSFNVDSSEYYGNSAACAFEEQNIVFPEFAQITKLTPAPFQDSGFEQEFDFNLPESQGYQNECYRFARGSGGRYISQSEQHVKFRIVHNPTSTCYLKVWFVKKITKTIRNTFCDPSVPFIETNISYEDLDYTYEWNGGTAYQNQCIQGGVGVYSPDAIIYGEEQTIEIPTPNPSQREFGVSEQILIKKVSFIKDYEPANPPESMPHGFESQDISLSSENCITCGSLPVSEGGTRSEDWNCPYKFIPILTTDEYCTPA